MVKTFSRTHHTTVQFGARNYNDRKQYYDLGNDQTLCASASKNSVASGREFRLARSLDIRATHFENRLQGKFFGPNFIIILLLLFSQ